MSTDACSKANAVAAAFVGDYAVIGTTLQITGESLCEAVDVSAGQLVLDVAAGNGNASLKAFAGLDERERAALEQELLRLADSHNTATDGTLRVPSDYLEIVVTTA